MRGPFSLGTWSNYPQTWDLGKHVHRLIRGQRHRVGNEFGDADGDRHPKGEEWIFLTAFFDRNQEAVVLCVRMICDSTPDEGETTITLLARDAAQARVIDRFLEYVEPVPPLI
jgi:hypothetical protein